MPVLDLKRDTVGLEELKEAFGQTQEVLTKVAQYSQPIREVQMVCEHPQQIIDLQHQITDLQANKFLPPLCDNTKLEGRIQTVTRERDEV